MLEQYYRAHSLAVGTVEYRLDDSTLNAAARTRLERLVRGALRHADGGAMLEVRQQLAIITD